MLETSNEANQWKYEITVIQLSDKATKCMPLDICGIFDSESG